ncbi:hypothetical protein O3P69_014109 [Scylla paramamosain]|uniref:Lipocalin/cytosolic fatty-acid binding domain-containing protein n=1 Tax=Scylla paramamosain TaxID=85552 RepID=A0AAW0SRZ7_SCYPA
MLCSAFQVFWSLETALKFTLKENFDPMKYSGLWFDIESVPNEYQYTKKCVTQNYTWTGEQMDVATRGLTDDDEKIRQMAVMVKDESLLDPASMIVQAAGVPEAPYQIIATDYRTYSCVYSCLDGYAGFMAEFMWVFSRTPSLPADKIKYCHDIFNNTGADPMKMVPVVQQDPCPYFEKLDKMLMESEKHLLKVMGPPSSSKPFTPSTIPPNLPPTTSRPRVQDNNMQEQMNVVHEEEEDLKHDLKSSSRSHDPPKRANGGRTRDSPSKVNEVAAIPPHGSSVRDAERTDPSTSSTFVPAIQLLFLLLTFLLCF